MTNAIVKKQIDLPVWQMIREAAPVMYKSRLFGVSTEEQAMAIMAKGYELGLGITTSFEFIQVIQGKPTLIPRGALALAYQSDEIESLKISDASDNKGQPYSCTVVGKRKGGNEYSVVFTMDDAKRAGLVKPDSGWTNYPANMLKWRAIGFWLDVVMPDVQGGMKRADEFGATVDAGGNVIDVVPTEAVQYVKQAVVVPSLDTLITEYGVDSVMAGIGALGNGSMPATDVEILALQNYLQNPVTP